MPEIGFAGFDYDSTGMHNPRWMQLDLVLQVSSLRPKAHEPYIQMSVRGQGDHFYFANPL